MAQSSTVGSISTSDNINYFYKDEYGKIHRMVKQIEIKQEPIAGSTANIIYTADVEDDIDTLVQMNTNESQFVTIQSGEYDVQLEDNTASCSIVAPQSSCSKSNGMTTVISSVQRHHYHSNNDQQQQQEQEQPVLYTYDDSKNNKYEPMDNRQQQLHQEPLLNVTTSEGHLIKCIQQQQLSNVKTPSKFHTSTSQNASVVQRKRKPEKAGKGLRHFSLKVCEKVKVKGTTTYNEVADELVSEEIQNQTCDSSNCDQKNIRRRVYDALNVLMALQIISKDKKEIRWIGLPSNTAEECTIIEEENEEIHERIKQKHEQLRELILQLVSFKSLIERNKEAELQGVIPTPNSSIQLPFIIVNTHKSTKINCSVTNDKSEYTFKFDDKFEMHDDAEVLKRMGLLNGLDSGQCSYDNIERAKFLVPPNFEKYVEVYGNGKSNSDHDGNLTYDSEEEMPSYDFAELTNDSSQHSFAHTANNVDITTVAFTDSHALSIIDDTINRENNDSLLDNVIGENVAYINNSDID